MSIKTLASRLIGGTLTRANNVRISRFHLAHRGGGRVVYGKFRDSSGRSTSYHVHARGIDWDRPVGLVFYLDGDYLLPNNSRIHSPNDTDMVRMGAIAAARNLVFVAVDTPDRTYARDGFTWWVHAEENGPLFREFAEWIIERTGADRRLIWLMGYSGGAEFITFELLARDPRDWLHGGGAILVGGGGSDDAATPPHPELETFPMVWWSGENDGSPTAHEPWWSAQYAAHEGIEAYRRAGYKNLDRVILPGVSHLQYDMPEILRDSLNRMGRTA